VPASSGTPEAVTPQGELADTWAMLGILIPVGLAVWCWASALFLRPGRRRRHEAHVPQAPPWVATFAAASLALGLLVPAAPAFAQETYPGGVPNILPTVSAAVPVYEPQPGRGSRSLPDSRKTSGWAQPRRPCTRHWSDSPYLMPGRASK
jgi:hypothetical protein